MIWIFRAIGVAALITLAAMTAFAITGISQSEVGARVEVAAAPQRFSPLPPVNVAARRSLLERSPFVPERTAFDRQSAIAPPPPVEAKLTGVFKIGKQLRASLMIGGQAITVKKGDDTQIGKVSSIEASAVVIEGATTRRLEMFKQ